MSINPDIIDMPATFERQARALTIAAAGRLHVLMLGPYATPARLLGRWFRSLLPAVTSSQAREIAQRYEQARIPGRWDAPPWRAPHHTISALALLGGSDGTQPGEYDLAKYGVLYLEDVVEFRSSVLNALAWRMPQRDAHVLAFARECPCGLRGSERTCTCSPYAVQAFRSRIATVAERFDMCIPIADHWNLVGDRLTVTHRDVRLDIASARSFAVTREQHTPCSVTQQDAKVSRIARVIADLALEETIEPIHVQEAERYVFVP